MVQRAPADKEGNQEAGVRRLDRELKVAQWRIPGKERPEPKGDRPANAPDWWIDDVEASQSFLQAYGGGAPA